MKEERILRLRQLVSKHNKVKRSQKKQIDILCNDILKSHTEFISHLKNFQFAADFYENILGLSTPEQLAKAVGEYFITAFDNMNIATVFMSGNKPEIFIHSTDTSLQEIPSQIGPYLNARLVKQVCQSGKVCTTDDLCEMDFFTGPAVLKKISLAAIGINKAGPSLGMLIFYRTASEPLTKSELTSAASITPGLSTALKNIHNNVPMCNV